VERFWDYIRLTPRFLLYYIQMEDTKTHKLVLYNDNEHDFLYIVACLIKFCRHEPLQAEQCAVIAHNKGKCSVKSGDFLELFELKTDLEDLELKTEIEAYESYMY
jgi:ATP-dependent Clp protease adaptor protein ClpS